MFSIKQVIASVVVLLSSGAAMAQSYGAVSTAKSLALASIESVTFKKSSQGFGVSQEVFAIVTYGNACIASVSSEAVFMNSSDINSRSLSLTLTTFWNKDDVRCTMEYMPVTRLVKLGHFSHPADGLFDSILVNGVEATEEREAKICPMVAGVLVNKSSGECVSFTNGCERSLMLASGEFRRTEGRECLASF
jgi:hypothetical protein